MSRFKRSRSSSKAVFLFIFLCIVMGTAGAAFFLFFEGEPPQAQLTSPEQYLGQHSVITVGCADAQSGLRSVSLTITQGDLVEELYRETFPRNGFTGMIGVAEKQVQIPFDPAESGFKDGPARVTLQTSDYSLRGFLKGNRTQVVKELTIDTTPPKIAILHSERYINPGGAGIVIYRSADPDIKSGVVINDDFHPGFLVGDGRDDTYICYFALPYSATSIDSSFVTASDPAGNQSKLSFSVVFKNQRFRQDQIEVSDGFLNNKIPEFAQHYPQMSGSMIEQYMFTNNDLRIENNQRISDLCQSPNPERMWEGRFNRMPGSTRAGFADHRTYYYQSKPIDQQVHLGIDLASTKHADVRAAEKGIVVHADYLGIYGNMIMIDHGQGVFSLYSHLSQMNVSVGDAVDTETVIGLTGTTGMAGGDHLHFSMLINGVFVTPKEWWDQHWIDVTIEEPLTESRFQ